MNREQILKSFLEDELLEEKGYLKNVSGQDASWNDFKDNKMVDVIKFAIEGVLNQESQTILTRRMNQFLDKD